MKQIDSKGKKIVFIDCETTGVDISKDKVIQVAAVRFDPVTGKIGKKVWHINPMIPIPEQASKIHGIYDKDVIDLPSFEFVSEDIKSAINGCVLAGYNINTFDIPMLRREFYDAGIEFNKDIETIDVFRIVKKIYSRTLGNMYERYTGKSAEGSHDAFNDCLHAFELLVKMIEVDKLPASVDGLNEFYYDEKLDDLKFVDSVGKLAYNKEGVMVFNFGKHFGCSVKENKDYALWMINNAASFPKDTIEIIKKEIEL